MPSSPRRAKGLCTGRRVFHRDQTQADRADAGRVGIGLVQHLRPGADGIAGKAGVGMGARVQRHDHLRIGQPVERQRARKADDMAAIDQAAAILAVGGVKMHFGGVLPQTGGEHMLGLFNRDAIDMVDLFADCVVAPTVRFTRQGEIVVGEIEAFGDDQAVGVTVSGRSGITVSGAGVSRFLRTITQRTYSSTGSSRWFRPVVRT